MIIDLERYALKSEPQPDGSFEVRVNQDSHPIFAYRFHDIEEIVECEPQNLAEFLMVWPEDLDSVLPEFEKIFREFLTRMVAGW